VLTNKLVHNGRQKILGNCKLWSISDIVHWRADYVSWCELYFVAWIGSEAKNHEPRHRSWSR